MGRVSSGYDDNTFYAIFFLSHKRCKTARKKSRHELSFVACVKERDWVIHENLLE